MPTSPFLFTIQHQATNTKIEMQTKAATSGNMIYSVMLFLLSDIKKRETNRFNLIHRYGRS